MKTLFREPLVHFLLIGSALFAVFSLFNDPAGSGSERIVISPGQIDFLEANFSRTWQRPPTEQELQGLLDSHVREEIFYREALALGLDKDDSVIRRRLKLKLEIMSDDLAGVITPNDEQLQQFLETHSRNFLIEPKLAFRHVFFKVDQYGNGAGDRAEKLLARLSGEGNKLNPDALGDSLMLPNSFGLTPVSEIGRYFGKSFVDELIKIRPEQWAGPIRSGYGLHLVLITEKVAGRLPELDEIRDVVERDWSVAHKKEVQDGIYKRLREKYTVVFEQPTKEGSSFKAVSEAQAAEGKLQ
jgi:hypothetical protein